MLVEGRNDDFGLWPAIKTNILKPETQFPFKVYVFNRSINNTTILVDYLNCIYTF